jgi:hypothetical protein
VALVAASERGALVKALVCVDGELAPAAPVLPVVATPTLIVLGRGRWSSERRARREEEAESALDRLGAATKRLHRSEAPEEGLRVACAFLAEHVAPGRS